MNRSFRIFTSAAIAAAVAVSMIACAGPDDEPSVDPETPAGGIGGTSTVECLSQGTWVLDVELSASLLGEYLESQGQTVVNSTGAGRETMRFESSGEFGNSVDVTYTIVSTTEGGDEVTVIQTHSGEPSAVWALQPDYSTVVFAAWDLGGSRVQTEAIVSGTSTGVQELPIDGATPGAMTTQCDSEGLVTQTEGSPFLKYWSQGE